MSEIIPIAVEKSYLEGKGLVAQGSATSNASVTTERPVSNSAHWFHKGKIRVSVIESEPAKVRIDGHPYDEFVHILKGRLILTVDDGREFTFEQGDSLIVPKGYIGSWHMPEQYRELVVIDTPPSTSN